MCTWRDQLLPKDKIRDEIILNPPYYDVALPQNDNDVFAFTGYVNPAADHWICVYDPESDKFFKKSNIIVYPRQNEFMPFKSVLSKGLLA